MLLQKKKMELKRGEKLGKGKGGWPSKNPGKPSGGGRNNSPPKGK